MAVERDQLAQKLIDAHHLDKQIESNGVLKAFKDGAADGFLKVLEQPIMGKLIITTKDMTLV